MGFKWIGDVKMDVSVIVPMYNVEKYIDNCIESLIKQTYREFEVLLIDDGSIDSTAQKCMAWKERDDRIKYFYQNNQGLGPARHKGIELAQGKYVCFVDSDDWVDYTFVEKMLNAARKYRADLVVCDFYSVYEDMMKYAQVNMGFIEKEDRSEAIQKIKSNSIWKILTEKKIWIEKDIRMPALPYEDFASFPLLVILANRIAAVEEGLYYYRCNRKGSIINTSNNYEKFVQTVEYLKVEAIRHGVYAKYQNELKKLIQNNAKYLLGEAKKKIEHEEYSKLKMCYAEYFASVPEWEDILPMNY